MLLDVNTATGSCDCGKYIRCTFYSSVYCIFVYAPFSVGSHDSEITFKAQLARNHIHADTSIRSTFRHGDSIASFVMVNLRANTQLTVTAVNRHSLARRVQTRAASDHFFWQNTRMFRLEFFAITVYASRSVNVHLISAIHILYQPYQVQSII